MAVAVARGLDVIWPIELQRQGHECPGQPQGPGCCA